MSCFATSDALSSTAAFLLFEFLFTYLGVKLNGWQYGVESSAAGSV